MNAPASGQRPADPSLRLARAALTRLIEPADLPGMALIAVAGPEDALAFIRSGAASSAVLEQEMTAVLAGAGTGRWQGLAEALGRWRPRLADLAPERDLRVVERYGGGLLVPEDPQWPAALADLQLSEPIALWMRGHVCVIPEQRRCIALVGSRDNTSYGANVTLEIAASLVQRGFTVISGGAYGIDAHAHRGALGAAPAKAGYGAPHQPPTLAVMAGGVDRFYPSGNEDLLRTVAESGAIVAEVPPGTNPTRYRFLQRNRLIAALCEVSVVVEARWRSGALNTAHHADGLSRTVGAVPGSVYSANSAGCHRLLREGGAVCVTDAADIAELAGVSGANLVHEPESAPALHDGLGVADLLLLDALPLHSASTVEKISVVAGLGAASVLAGLGRLELMGLAQRSPSGWKRGGK
ncbi:DNA processing protein DprA [Arthrobacter sp. ERGS1:01]|uniref:DNA-processing protein DprA n=1 Tax=Arthrobacter sp. ERGS1:01 TaxID=1704044 RepID=UPI0006B4DDEB|nr:DNA-processing protein DprA [Arthrobacter sp. ERGS1:01]ALE06400.1 DNA processing protein DprA [Arthrobacter sp. ERGS1:01]